ncbi:hypothetical protein PHMEG_00040374 [Phytophthora megakarya]|uniref:Sugar transporter SWEET1 n=1 Tax=Phytophthora megakarya TaxID=4795 RepID=A0A225UDJ0_9STRA|nr:hypothetical protein PHMEG_00040374 [Phytophthora megakarya]
MTVLAPFPDFWRIYKTRSTGSVSVLPALLIFCNCYTWVMYARLVNSIPPLFVTYAIGMLASISFCGIYYHWTHDHARMHKLYSLVFYTLAGYTFYYSLGTSGASNQSDDAVRNTLGILSGLVNLALYASPLETIKLIIEQRDASTIPIIISVIFLVNSAIWVLHSVAEGDMLVLVPNALGFALCIVQVVLYVLYYPRRTSEISLQTANSSACETVNDV